MIALFTLTFFARGVLAMPTAELKKSIGRWSIQEQSDRLDLNELNQGDAEFSGAAIRLLLTGSRGFAICALWISAQEKQARHEWNELELIIKSITKLQPHFETPWLFQSWNLTYNVSVEMDRLNDMYFYIARGINLLAEGETANRYNPQLRYANATYYQNKFTVSDKVTTLRSLFQMSCMPKDERDYRTLLKGGRVDLNAFKAFCEAHPQFVRRLRETAIPQSRDAQGNEQDPRYLVKTPMDVVQFLKDNEVLPNRFRDDAPKMLEERLKQFPVLPARFDRRGDEQLNADSDIGDGQASAVRIARLWFLYANEVVPLPGESNLNYRDPEGKRRVPKQPSSVIFRQGPSRAQTFVADQLSKEGWFDQDDWVVDDQRVGSNRWFKEDVKIKPTGNAKEEWARAYDMWLTLSRAEYPHLQPAERIAAEKRAKIYANKRGFQIESAELPPLRADEQNDPVLLDSLRCSTNFGKCATG